MEETSTAAVQPAEPMSLAEKLMNVIVAPRAVFENVRDTPKSAATWFVPLLISMVITFVMMQVTMNNPVIVDQYKAMTQEAAEKRIQERVEQGKMTAEQADQARAQMEQFTDPTSTMATIMRDAFVIIGLPIVFFIVTLVYWLLGKVVVKATIPFGKVLEVTGLAAIISSVESIVKTIIVFVAKNLHAGLNLGLAVLSDFSTENKLHLALARIDVFTIWYLVVISIGLAAVFRREFSKIAVLVFALWILWAAFSVAMGFQTM